MVNKPLLQYWRNLNHASLCSAPRPNERVSSLLLPRHAPCFTLLIHSLCCLLNPIPQCQFGFLQGSCAAQYSHQNDKSCILQSFAVCVDCCIVALRDNKKPSVWRIASRPTPISASIPSSWWRRSVTRWSIVTWWGSSISRPAIGHHGRSTSSPSSATA